jgi:hypothetical protein
MVALVICQACRNPFTPRRSTARFCGGRCRVAAHRASGFCNATTAPQAAAHASKLASGGSAPPRLSVTEKLPSGIVPDATYPGMYRLRLPAGRLSDMLNLTRARDALWAITDGVGLRGERAVDAGSQASLATSAHNPP